jgi:polygalacturonase
MPTPYSGFIAVAFLAPALWAASPSYDIRDFGAKTDPGFKNTAAIQAALDKAASDGGGTVLIPAGRFVSGTIHLRSNTTLSLSPGAVLAASADQADFDAYEKLDFKSVSDNETTYFHHALIAAENVHNIAITGQGTIDGNRTRRGGPKTIALKRSQHIAIRGVTVMNSPNYSISMWGCDWVDIDGVTILNGYSDGIDPDSSKHVRIANCYIDSYDDAICPKASPLPERRAVENLVVTNCVLRTNCSNFKFGTESSGDFRNVTVSNCVMVPRERGRKPLSGISLESVDGANIDGVTISNITMEGVEAPIFIRLGNRGRGLDPPVPGSVQNVSISAVNARGSRMASSITGLPGHLVRHVSLDNISQVMDGGFGGSPNYDVPEHAAKYPEGNMFGTLPAYSLYGRHVDDLTITNFRTRTVADDRRSPLVFDDVKNLELVGIRAQAAADVKTVVHVPAK